MNCNRLTIMTLAGVLATLVAGTANATNTWPTYDRKSYTGAQCQPATGAQNADFNIFAGRLRNASPGYRWASCAIALDQEGTIDSTDVTATTSAGPIEILTYLDYSAVPAGFPYTTDCTIRSVEPLGTSKVVADSVSSHRTTGNVSIDFTSGELAALDGVTIGNHASLQLSCRLPPGGAIEVVKIYENGGTGNYRYTP